MDIATATIISSISATFGAIVVALINKYKPKTSTLHCRSIAEMASPKSHYYFAKMNYYLTSIIPNMKTCEGVGKLKCDLIKRFLYIKFSIFKKGMEDWVNREEVVKLDETVKYIMLLVSKYEREADEVGIPKVFIEAFAREHQPIVDATLQCLEQIMRCESYDNVDKENAVLDSLLQSFILTVASAERTARNMNGELESYLQEAERLRSGL